MEENNNSENSQSRPKNPHRNANRNRPPKDVDGNKKPTPKAVDGNRRPNNNNNNRRKPASNATQTANPNANSGNKNGARKRGGKKFDVKVDANLLDFVDKNRQIHHARLNPHYKLDLETKGKLRITPLGGLGEIGGNIMVVETQKEAILVDIGMSFPDEEMHGVDILVPDFSYLHEIKDKLVAFVITHAHEDHIGAVPYLFKELQMPIYGTSFPLAMIGNKFDEHKMAEYKKFFRPVQKREIISIGEDFELEWIHMTHSILDSSSLAITTDIGTIIHTGDFKIDHTPVDGYPADLHRLAHYGEKGVVCLLSDSTNSYNVQHTPSEITVAPALDRIYSKHEGRIFISTFSSNIHRVEQAIRYGMKYNRKICVIGRSMERNLEVAMQYKYIDLPKDIFIDQDEVNRFNDNEVLIVTTGSQGEANSALFRMALGEHRHVKIKPSDMIILSSRAIPGNEAGISKMLNYLQRAGAQVAPASSDIHVSGHAGIEEQKLMLRLTNPKFFLPVHGEYNHIYRHAQTAKLCGIPERNILLMSDGDQVELTPKYLRKVRTVKTGKTYIDNQNNNEIEDDIVIDRQKLAQEGIVMLIAQIDKATGKMLSKPRVTTFGLVPDKKDKAFAHEIEDMLEIYLTNVKEGLMENPKAMENDLRQVVRKHINRKMKKFPLIVPTVYIM